MPSRSAGVLAALLLLVAVAVSACGGTPARVRPVAAATSRGVALTAASSAPARGVRVRSETIGRFLTDELRSVQAYWTNALAAQGRPAPQVRHVWLAPGATARTACGPAPRDQAAFYCSHDDTIYVSKVFAAGLRDDRAGGRDRTGAFSVAYLLAHELAHDVQQETGAFASHHPATAMPFELQADCMAGLWAASQRAAGLIGARDVVEATNEAQALGDFQVGNPRHHGTPAQRRAAFLAGLRSGRQGACDGYLAGS